MADELRVPLRLHIDQRLRDLELRLSEQRSDLKDRLEAMNEVKEILRDQQSRMATRDQLEDLRMRVDRDRAHVATLAGTVGVLVSIVVVALSRLIFQ